jgi:hypothetical protein
MGGRGILVSLIVAGLAWGCSDAIDSYYPTLLEAKRAGAVEKGWIPPEIPSSSRDIFERHDLDSNRGWIKFNYNQDQHAVFLQGLAGSPVANLDSIALLSPKVGWWHGALIEGNLRVARREFGFEVYHKKVSVKNEYGIEFVTDWYFAMDPSSGVAYVWHAPGKTTGTERPRETKRPRGR